jgi:hypothetical protein
MHKKIGGKMYLQKRGLYGSKKDAQVTASYIKRHQGYKSARVILRKMADTVYILDNSIKP